MAAFAAEQTTGAATDILATIVQCKEDNAMNWDRIEGNWKQFKGTAMARWGKLTGDQLDVVAGRRDQLIGRIQEAYGITRETAERQLAQWQGDQRDGQSVEENQKEDGKALKDVQ